MPKIERLDLMSWQIDGVFVDLYGMIIIRGKTAQRAFWIGIDKGKPVPSGIDVVRVANQLIKETTDLGIQMNRVSHYMYPIQFDYGLQHTGLSFTWEWTFSEHVEKLDDLQHCHFEKAEKRSLDSIARLIALLKSKGVPLSEQHPYSPKNTWLNHFRPTVEHLMSLGPGFWLPALTLSIPCIDAAYQDWFEDQYGERPKNPYTEAMLRWIFDPEDVYHEHENLNKAIDLLREGLANGLKHDTLIREPISLYNPYLTTTYNEPPNFAVYLGGDETKTILSVRVDSMGVESVMVFPSLWWETIRNRIDQHYKLL